MLMVVLWPVGLLWWGLLVLWPWVWARRRGRSMPWITRLALGLSAGAVGVAVYAWPRDVVVAGFLPIPTALLWWDLAEPDRPPAGTLYPVASPPAASCQIEPPHFARDVTQAEVKAAVANMIRESARATGEVDWDCVVGRFNDLGEEAWVVFRPAANAGGADYLRFNVDAQSARDAYYAVPGGQWGPHQAVIVRTAAGDVGLINWDGDQRTTALVGSEAVLNQPPGF